MAICEIHLLDGDVIQLATSIAEAEKTLSDAARSGQSRLAWFEENPSGRRVGINPAHVASLRANDPS